MLCERCKKREANVIVTEVVDGIKKQHSYCMKCASELRMGSLTDFEIPLGKLLSGILGLALEEEETEQEELKKLTCPSCGMKYGEFLKEGHFGCADCYVTFGPLIGKNIKKLQANDTHVGKRPANRQNTKSEIVEKQRTPEEELKLLQSRLEEALQEENYEDAVLYRDQIKKWKEILQSSLQEEC